MTALNQTWEELRTSLLGYVRMKAKPDVAEDIVHDILLRVLQNEDKLRTVDHPIAWVYAVAKNRITDFYRDQAKLKNSEVDVEQVSAESAEMIENMDHEFAQCLRPLTERLDEKYKQALLLTDFGEQKQTEAAKQVGISVSGMKSRVQRARSKLKEELLNCCAVEVDHFGQIVDYARKDHCKPSDCC